MVLETDGGQPALFSAAGHSEFVAFQQGRRIIPVGLEMIHVRVYFSENPAPQAPFAQYLDPVCMPRRIYGDAISESAARIDPLFPINV